MWTAYKYKTICFYFSGSSKQVGGLNEDTVKGS